MLHVLYPDNLDLGYYSKMRIFEDQKLISFYFSGIVCGCVQNLVESVELFNVYVNVIATVHLYPSSLSAEPS